MSVVLLVNTTRPAILEIGIDPLKGLTIAELARDHRAEDVAMLKSCADENRNMTEAEGEASKDRHLRRSMVDELLLAAGDIIQRFIRLKLRDWARKQTETV